MVSSWKALVSDSSYRDMPPSRLIDNRPAKEPTAAPDPSYQRIGAEGKRREWWSPLRGVVKVGITPV